jgi:hypothetical protein
MGNVILGAVALAILQGVLSKSAATARVGGVIASAGKAVEWFVSPAVPAFKGAASTTSSTALAVEAAASGATPSTAAPSTSVPPTPATSPFSFPGESPQTQAQGGAV